MNCYLERAPPTAKSTISNSFCQGNVIKRGCNPSYYAPAGCSCPQATFRCTWGWYFSEIPCRTRMAMWSYRIKKNERPGSLKKVRLWLKWNLTTNTWTNVNASVGEKGAWLKDPDKTNRTRKWVKLRRPAKKWFKKLHTNDANRQFTGSTSESKEKAPS